MNSDKLDELKDIFKNKNPKGLTPFDCIIIGIYIDDEKVYDLDFFKNYVNDSQIECVVNNDIIDEWYMYDDKLWQTLKDVVTYDIECDIDNEWANTLDEEIEYYKSEESYDDIDSKLNLIEELMRRSPSVKEAKEKDAALRENVLGILNEIKKIKDDIAEIKAQNSFDFYPKWPQPYITYPNVPPKQLEIWYNNDNKENSNPNRYSWRNSWVYDPGPYCSTISSNAGENSTITTTDQRNKEVCVNLPSPTNHYTISYLNTQENTNK